MKYIFVHLFVDPKPIHDSFIIRTKSYTIVISLYFKVYGFTVNLYVSSHKLASS